MSSCLSNNNSQLQKQHPCKAKKRNSSLQGCDHSMCRNTKKNATNNSRNVTHSCWSPNKQVVFHVASATRMAMGHGEKALTKVLPQKQKKFLYRLWLVLSPEENQSEAKANDDLASQLSSCRTTDVVNGSWPLVTSPTEHIRSGYRDAQNPTQLFPYSDTNNWSLAKLLRTLNGS